MWNILELTNNTTSTQEVTVKTFDINGNLLLTLPVIIDAGGQEDLLVHDFDEIVDNSYGIITIQGSVTGRMLYYRPNGSNFDFAFSTPISNQASTSTSTITFNTFEPSLAPVQNWLSILNLEQTAQTYTINEYSQNGTLLSQRVLSLAALSREDIIANPGNPNIDLPANRVGLVEIIPQNSGTQYIAQLVRYGIQNNGIIDFALPLLAKSAGATNITVPINTENVIEASSNIAAENFLEVSNPNSTSATVNINLYDSNGNLTTVQNQAIPAFGQIHLLVNSLMAAQEVGYVELSSNLAINTNSIVYKRNDNSQALESVYSLQAESNFPTIQSNSYNLFLGMQNLLRLNNITDSAITYTLDIEPNFTGSTGSQMQLSIPARQSIDLDLSNTSLFGTAINTFGGLTITAPSTNSIQSYVLRSHPDFSVAAVSQLSLIHI